MSIARVRNVAQARSGNCVLGHLRHRCVRLLVGSRCILDQIEKDVACERGSACRGSIMIVPSRTSHSRARIKNSLSLKTVQQSTSAEATGQTLGVGSSRVPVLRKRVTRSTTRHSRLDPSGEMSPNMTSFYPFLPYEKGVTPGS